MGVLKQLPEALRYRSCVEFRVCVAAPDREHTVEMFHRLPAKLRDARLDLSSLRAGSAMWVDQHRDEGLGHQGSGATAIGP